MVNNFIEGAKEDLEFFESLSKEKIRLLLKKANERDNSSQPTPPEEYSEYDQYYKFCGAIIANKQKICPVCGKMVI